MVELVASYGPEDEITDPSDEPALRELCYLVSWRLRIHPSKVENWLDEKGMIDAWQYLGPVLDQMTADFQRNA